MKKLSRLRCAMQLALFLASGALDAPWSGDERLAWLLLPSAALLGAALLRVWTHLSARRRLFASRCAVPLAAALAGAELGRLCLFISSHNDFALSPLFIALLAAAVELLLALTADDAFARVADIGVSCAAALLALCLFTGGGWDLARLLPLRAGTTELRALLRLTLSVFAQGFVAAALLADQAEASDLRGAIVPASLAAGAVLGLERLKLTCTAGFEAASRFAFPAYACSAVRWSGSYGLHVEEALLCALFAARLLRGAMLLRFCRRSLRGKGSGRAAAVLCACAAAAIMLLTADQAGAQRWRALLPWASAVCCVAAPALSMLLPGEKRR